MEDQNYNDKEIIKYLDGELSKSELADFNARMENDSSFKKRVEEYQHMIKGIESHERNELSKTISKLGDNNASKKDTNHNTIKILTMNQENKNKSRLPVLLAAASLLVLVGYFFVGKQSSFNPDKIFTENYSETVAMTGSHLKDLATKNLASRNADPKDTMTVIYNGDRIKVIEFEAKEKLRRDSLIGGINLFKKSDWEKALIHLNEYVERYPTPLDDHSLATFYLSKAKLNYGKYADAVQGYNDFLNAKLSNKTLNHQAEWDRAMCYLKIDTDQVKKYLSDMANDNSHKYQDEAKGLISYFE